MGLFSRKHQEPKDDYSRGYNASREFSEIVMEDDSITDEQLAQQYDTVTTTHSSEYARGYNDFIDDEMERLERPWWKLW